MLLEFCMVLWCLVTEPSPEPCSLVSVFWFYFCSIYHCDPLTWEKMELVAWLAVYLYTHIWVDSWQNQQNYLCDQRRLRSAWAQRRLRSTWVAEDPMFLHADSEDSDQNVRMPRLIWVFTGRKSHFVGFVMRRLIFKRLFFTFLCSSSWCWSRTAIFGCDTPWRYFHWFIQSLWQILSKLEGQLQRNFKYSWCFVCWQNMYRGSFCWKSHQNISIPSKVTVIY